MTTRTSQAEGFATFYGITIEEAQARIDKWEAHDNLPEHPICMGCARTPDQIPTYVECGEYEEISATEYVISEEGTYNVNNGHFLCDSCYIKNGQPSSSRGWKCP